MYRARSLASAIVATVATAAALTGVVWLSAVLAARGTSQAILPTLLTTNSFAGLEWPFRADQPPVAVHITFYLAVLIVALVAGLVTLLAIRKAAPRNGAAAFLGTWFGVVLGSILAAGAVYFMRVDALAASAGARNEVLATLLRGFTYGGLLLGLVPAVLSWATFKIANRQRAAKYVEAMDLAEGKNADENPFDLAPGSISDERPVEPGFTYPAGEAVHDGAYRDADLPPSERRTGGMTFSDVTDATGEDFGERDEDAPSFETVAAEPREVADVSFGDDQSVRSTDDESQPPVPTAPVSPTPQAPTAEVTGDQVDDLGSRPADYGLDDNGTPRDAELRQTGT